MAQETKVEETRCSLQTFERNRYFYGKPMTVSDFEAEQRYLIGKHRYINRLIHGAGVLCGLQVTLPTGFSAERPRVELAEGAALDCCGNLIINSRSGTAEIKGDFNPVGSNYLYIKYTECSKQPVMLSANGSSCEEVCCYNRIQETFEIVASPTAPGGGEAAASGADTTPTSSLKTGATPTLTRTAGQTVASAEPPPDPESVCRALAEQYYQQHLKTCPGCDDPLVFLAVLDPVNKKIDEAETIRHRSVVFNNSMLHELLCGHVTDLDNPHRTSAAQVLALQSVNGVGNGENKSFVGNIDLRSNDSTIGITPDNNIPGINLVLGQNSVKRSHLHEDVVKNLIQSSNTVTATGTVDASGKRITLNTKPAASVTSVGGTRVVGTSSKYAPEDHAHDLAEKVVGRKHLSADVYTDLLQGGSGIKVEPDAAAQTIKLSADVAAPAKDPALIRSVSGTKSVGNSERYAREDHVHDLFINGRSPSELGMFLLTPGENVTIKDGNNNNELVISAAGGSQTEVTTGIFLFEGVRPQELRTSTLIAHKLDNGVVAVILAEEEWEGIPTLRALAEPPPNAVTKFGDITAFAADAPFLMATVDHTRRTIQISLKDRRQPPSPDPAIKPAGDSGGFTPSSGFDPNSPLSDGSPFGNAPLSGNEEEGVGFIEKPAARTASAIVSPDVVFNPNPDERTYRIRWWAIPGDELRLESRT